MVKDIVIIILLISVFIVNFVWAAYCKKINDEWTEFCKKMNTEWKGLCSYIIKERKDQDKNEEVSE